MKTNITVRALVGSMSLLAACATDETPFEQPETVDRRPTSPTAPTAPASECQGEAVDQAALGVEVTVDAAAGLATATIKNHTETGHYPQAKLTMRKAGGGQEGIEAAPVFVPPGGSAVVRFSLADLPVAPDMPTQLTAEISLLDAATGAVSERVFGHAFAGPSLSATAARLGVPMSGSQKGQAFTLGGIVTGGRGVDITQVEPTHDTIDDLAQDPNLPLPSFNYDMCFRWPVTLVDAGFGEDYGTDPTSPWVARGGRVSIVQNGKTLFDGYLDANGCTGTFKAASGFDFSIFGYSRARINNNDVIARDANGQMKSFVIWDADPGMNQHPVYVFPEVAPVTTLLAVSAYTLQKFHGGMTGKTISVENRCDPVGGCCDCANGNGLWVTQADRKFLIGHEMGHRILSLFTGGYTNDVSFDLDPNNNAPFCDTSSSHSMWSAELDSGAAMEGWAHFMAVAAFNDRAGTNPGASMTYWSGDTVVDVEQGPAGGVSNYFDTMCSIQFASKLDVELDWLRHWWDYYSNATDVDPGARPSMTQMMREIDAAPAWGAATAWTNLRQGVLDESGAAQQDRWDQHGTWNGID